MEVDTNKTTIHVVKQELAADDSEEQDSVIEIDIQELRNVPRDEQGEVTDVGLPNEVMSVDQASTIVIKNEDSEEQEIVCIPVSGIDNSDSEHASYLVEEDSSDILDSSEKKQFKFDPAVLNFLKRAKKPASKPSDGSLNLQDDSGGDVRVVVETEDGVETHGISLQRTAEGDTIWCCSSCDKGYQDRQSALVHLREHTLVCELCQESFGTIQSLADHLQDVHDKLPFTCDVCSDDFACKGDLEKHMLENHDIQLEKRYHCDYCGFSTDFKRQLKDHIQVKHPDTLLRCGVCNQRFEDELQLAKHSRKHITGHSCPFCPDTFAEKRSLTIHLMRMHSDVADEEEINRFNKFECEECGKRFYSKGNFNVHMRIHTNTMPYSCSVCGKKFAVKSNMVRHERAHTGAKPWQCPDCDKSFTERSSMLIHRRLHTGEKPHKCEHCGKRFYSLSTLHSHLPTHTRERKYKCDQCQAAFLRRTHLVVHLRTHLRDPSMPCIVCGAKYTTRSDLTRHLVEDHNARERSRADIYDCHLCPKIFKMSARLQAHLKNSHSVMKEKSTMSRIGSGRSPRKPLRTSMEVSSMRPKKLFIGSNGLLQTAEQVKIDSNVEDSDENDWANVEIAVSRNIQI